MLSDGKYKKYLTPVYLFSYLILLAFVVHAILLIENPEGAQRYMYFEGFKNLFADYFSCIRHSSDKNPYFSDYFFQSNYLPFVHILYYPFSQLDNFAEMTLENFYESKIGMFSCFFFNGIAALIFVHSLICLCNKYKTNKIVIPAILLSGIMLHTFERANIIVLAGALLIYFVTYYDSENVLLSYFAATCLALVAVIKIYPVLFGILYLEKKYVKQIIYSACLTLILIFLPFLFFEHGFENIPKLISTVKNIDGDSFGVIPRFEVKYWITYASYFVFGNASRLNAIARLARPMVLSFSLLSLFVSIMDKSFENKLVLILSVILFFPSFSFLYCGIYLSILIIYVLSDDRAELNKSSLFLIIALFITFIPITITDFYVKNGREFIISTGNIIRTFIPFVIWVVKFLEIMIVFIKNRGFQVRGDK